MIPYGRQDVGDPDIAAVTEVLRGDWLTQGPAVPRFEAALCGAAGAGHAVAVNSATSALHLACLALDLRPGGLLWTSPVTFVASANVALMCGADADFVDIDPDTANMSAAALAAKLEEAESKGRLPDIVMPVHFGGQSCDMEAIGALAERYGFRVIEDASHAIGGAYDRAPVGACAHSDICVFSFHPVKIVTTGEGGAALTNDATLARRMALLRTHGVTRDADLMVRGDAAPWEYEQIALGFNYRMTDIAAALGVSQLGRLADFVAARGALADRYDALLADLPARPLARDPKASSAWHLYVVRLDPARRRAAFEALRAAGIGVNVHYIPVHTQPFWRARGFAPGDFPAAEAYYAAALTLPLFPGLTQDEQDHVAATLGQALA